MRGSHSRRHLYPCVEIIPNSGIAVISRPFLSTSFHRIVMTESSSHSALVYSRLYCMYIVLCLLPLFATVISWQEVSRCTTFNWIRKIELFDLICIDNWGINEFENYNGGPTYQGNSVASFYDFVNCVSPECVSKSDDKAKTHSNFIFHEAKIADCSFKFNYLPCIKIICIVCSTYVTQFLRLVFREWWNHSCLHRR